MLLPAAIGALGWTVSFAVMILGTFLTLRLVNRKLYPPKSFSPISVLKPLKGYDEGLEENLISFFEQDYPEFEILFGVASEKDPSIPTVEKLQKKFPMVKAKLFVITKKITKNPKINVLQFLAKHTQFETLLISDSNVRVSPNYLKELSSQPEIEKGILTAFISGSNGRGLGGLLNSHFLNTFYARGMTLGATFNRAGVVGKCMLLNQATLKRFGGFGSLGGFLAEDYMAGYAIEKLGLKIILSSVPATENIGKMSLKDYWKRHVRWGRLRKKHVPISFTFEPLQNAFLSALLGIGFTHLMDIPVLPFFLFHFITWGICDAILVKKLDPTFSPILLPLVWLVREVLAIPLQAAMIFGNSVVWRNQKIKISQNGLISES